MLPISQNDIDARLARDNPWWSNETTSAFVEDNLPRRVYFEPFTQLALNFNVRRAAILLGPRRVGKTVMIKQVIAKAISDGIPRKNVLYVSIDTPLYTNLNLQYFVDKVVASNVGGQHLIVFDEIQYLKDWQTHLKDLVDSYPNVKFVASGSAAAALSLQSRESGAGRFSDFMLPPLTFSEYLEFSGNGDLVSSPETGQYECVDIRGLNKHFIDYLNFGGYPEAVFNETVRHNPDQFIRIEIIEKVLLKDLPSLYGIKDIQELNKLFMVLAYNAGNEISYENISKSSGITKPTIKKYI
jgi:predicted AAA+ superfamily ATPase